MKKIIGVIGFFTIMYNPVFCQQYMDKEFCKYWQITPILYNTVVSDSEVVKYWENYWYYCSKDNPKFIPDTLKIELVLSPSMEIFPKVEVPNSVYTFLSTLQFKYGDDQDSYNVINPKLSDTIELINQKVNLKDIYLKMIESTSMGKSFYTNNILLNKIMDSLNIHLERGPWNYNKAEPLYLNQILINTYFINANGEVRCNSEFTFPINGAYLNGKCCESEF